MQADPLIDQVVAGILDGTPIDWADVGSGATESTRAVLHELRAIAAIGSVTRSFAGSAHAVADRPMPATWGHLRLLEPLGRGAFGAVYRAWDPRLDREVALKLLSTSDPSTDAVVEEGRLLARVHHPNVVTIFGADRIDGCAGLWMELVRGDTLEQILTREGPLPTSRVQNIAEQLLAALGAVHSAGLIHRDVKTQNVMLTGTGRVVLMDFGAGRMADSTTSDVAGTPLYLAPEIFARQPATAQSDIYAAGVVLYRLLTGRFPVAGRTYNEVRSGHRTADRGVDGQGLPRRVPRRFARAIERSLASRAEERFSTAGQMAAALAPRRTSPLALVAAAAAVVSIAAGASLFRVAVRQGGGRPTNAAVQAAVSGDTARARRLTVPDDALYFLAGLSADGRFFSYTAQDGSVRQIAMGDGSVRTLVPADGDQTAEFAISSADGSNVAFQWWNAHERYELRVYDSGSGSTRTLLDDPSVAVPQPVQWSSDGADLLVLERMLDGSRRIVLIGTTDGHSRVVREFSRGTPLGLSLAPDGRTVAFDVLPSDGSRFRTVHLIRADGSEERTMSGGEYSDWSPLWTPDGRGIFFLSDRTGAADGWFAPVTGTTVTGEAQVLVRNLARSMPLGFTTDGGLYYRLQTGAFDVYSVNPASAGPPQRVSGRSRGANIGAQYSPDGTRVAYITVRDGYGSERDRALVIRNLTSGEERELHPLAEVGVAAPRWSPDGRMLLVHGSAPPQGAGVWAVDVETGQARHVISPDSEKDETAIGPVGWDTTPDGAVFERAGLGLIRHSIVTSEERTLYSYAQAQSTGRIHRFGFSGAGTPRLAFSAFVNGSLRELAVVEKGIKRTIATVNEPEILVFQGWSGDGVWVYYTVVPPKAAAHELWRVPAEGGPPERLPFMIPGATQINAMSVNQVTGDIAYTAGTPTNEMWMMEGILPKR